MAVQGNLNMKEAPDTKEIELEYQHADPYIVKLLNTTRDYLELDKKASIDADSNRPNRSPSVVVAANVTATS